LHACILLACMQALVFTTAYTHTHSFHRRRKALSLGCKWVWATRAWEGGPGTYYTLSYYNSCTSHTCVQQQTNSPKELKIKGVHAVVAVSCGYYHTAIVTGTHTHTHTHTYTHIHTHSADAGELYVCGEGEGGKLGLGAKHTKDAKTPAKVGHV
jgi:hypothetical protein